MSSLGLNRTPFGPASASGPPQHDHDPKGKGKGRDQGSIKPKNKKKQNARVWHKFKGKKNLIPPMLRCPNEVFDNIFKHVFTGVHMIDVKTTQRGTVQRRYGAHSILFVCKEIREVATKSMFQYASFDIPHFKLHEKHRRENKMTTLHKIQHLVLLWTPPPSASFTTKRGDDGYILREMRHLRSLRVWLLACQHLRLQNIMNPECMSRVELHDAILAKFEPSVNSQPRWLKRLLRDTTMKFEGIDVSLVGFFAFGYERGEDLTAAHISWPSRTINCTETIKWVDWQRARAGFTCRHLRYRSLWDMEVQFLQPRTAQGVELAKAIMGPGIGDRTFGRKIW